MELLWRDPELEVVPLVGGHLGTDSGGNTGKDEGRDGDPGVAVEDDLRVGVGTLCPPSDESVVPLLPVTLEEGDLDPFSPAHHTAPHLYIRSTRHLLDHQDPETGQFPKFLGRRR